MRKLDRPAAKARLGLLFLAPFFLASARAAQHGQPAIPEPPEPPAPPEVSVRGFDVHAGETYKGNVIKIVPSSSIEGTLDGDLYLTASDVHITGVVTGDVFVAGSEVDVSGEVRKSFRAAAGNVVLDGTVEGNVLVTGGNFTLGSKAHVKGNVSAYTGQFTNHGTIEGSLTFTGGTAVLGGKVEDDATITADAIEVEHGARIDGDVTYSTRRRMDSELKAITGGDVTYDENAVREKKLKRHDAEALRPTKFGVGKWIAFFTASFLFGCALLAIFREHEPKVTTAIQADTLRCAGVGFVSVLVSIAVCLSMILLITIPFALIYLLAYIVAIYLAKIPVAIWLGRFVLAKLNRPAGVYMTLLLGLVLLYLLFMIPVLGIILQIAAALLGVGAMTISYLAYRQARKAMAGAPPAGSAVPPPHPAV